MSTLRPSSFAHRSAIVSPKKPDPTTTRSWSTAASSWGCVRESGLRSLPAQVRLASSQGRCVAEGAPGVAGLVAVATQQGHQSHRGGDRVGLGADERVLAVPQVHHEEVAVHVVALPRPGVVLLVEVELTHEHRVAQTDDREPGSAYPQRVVDVVVEDEES